jgi:hypothetical protein
MKLSADPTGEIDQLVEALHAARSPWAKVKVLAREWRTVRKLRPEERFLVAKHVGLEGAEDYLDSLGDAYRGLPTEELLDIVRAADAEDFERWKRVVSRLQRPREREALLQKSLEEVKGALIREENPPLPAPPPEQLEIAEVATEEPAPTPHAEEPVEPDIESLVEVVEVEEEPPSQEPEPTPEIEIEVEAVAEVVEQAAEEPEPIDEPKPPPSAEPVLPRLMAAENVLSRLRQFGQLMDEMRLLDAEHLREILDCLPAGWPRRRGLTRLLLAGIPERFEDALALIESLEKPSDRLWCMSALVDGRALTRDDKKLLLDLEELPMVRRRLKLRLSHP